MIMNDYAEAEHVEDEAEDYRKIEQLISLNNFSLALMSYRAVINDFDSFDDVIINKLLDYYTNSKHSISIDSTHLKYYREKKYPFDSETYPIQLNIKKVIKQEFILNSIHKLNTIEIQDYTTFYELDNKHLALFFKNDDHLLESLLSDVCKLNHCFKVNNL